MNKLVAPMVILVAIIVCIIKWSPQGNGLVNCWYGFGSDDFAPGVTPEACEAKKVEHEQKIEEKNKAGKEIGCYNAEIFCEGKNKKEYFSEKENNKWVWIETLESKRCSSYYMSKLSDLPVSCLSYFGVEK